MRTRLLAPFVMLPPVVMAFVLAPPVARPLPLYSRSLGVACASCHDVGSRLDAFGTAFAERGHRPAGDATVSSSRSGGLPLSVVASVGLTGTHAEPERVDDGGPLERGTVRGSFSTFELVAAGSPVPRVFGHLEAGLSRAGVDARRGDDFVQLGDLGPRGAFALKLGRFAAELPFLSSERRLTKAAYLAPVAFGARGVELDGSRADWTAAAGLSLSERTRAGGASPRAIRPPLEDTYLQLGRRFGAQAIGAQMLFDRQDSHLATLSWLQHLRGQVAAEIAWPWGTLIPAYVFDRFDDRPAPGVHEHHQIVVLESIVPLAAENRWTMTARYEHDYRTRNTYDPEQHRQQAVLQLGWQPSPNARFAVECARRDDRLARQGRADLDAFAQASW